VPPIPLPQLRRVRLAVRAALTLGVAASVAANLLHANPNPISQAIAAWPPLALLITVELISRVPMDRRILAAARLVATTAIAGIAAYVSYWHMAGVASRYGERGPSPYLLPLSVDGLIIVASVSLVELARHIRTTESENAAAEAFASPTAAAPRPPVAAADAPRTTVARAGNPDRRAAEGLTDRRTNMTPTDPAHHEAADPAGTGFHVDDLSDPSTPPAPPNLADHPDLPPGADADTRTVTTTEIGKGVLSETAAAVAYWRHHQPQLRPAEIAQRVGKSERQVRRILATLDTAEGPSKQNGTPVQELTNARR